MEKTKKEDYTNPVYDLNLIKTNELLEKFLNCKYYNNGKNVYKIYEYYFKGDVKINSETGLVDEIIFECKHNENYNSIIDEKNE